jgi:hypothetical protein
MVSAQLAETIQGRSFPVRSHAYAIRIAVFDMTSHSSTLIDLPTFDISRKARDIRLAADAGLAL